MNELILNYFIVDYGSGSKILSYAKTLGLNGGTIFQAQGTINNAFLKILNFDEKRKDVVIIIELLENNPSKLSRICTHFQFDKQDHGIGFNVRINNLYKHNMNQTSQGDTKMSENELIFAIVEKGKGELVVEAAQRVGATGATIINARGAGVHETTRIFSIEIEPEKEIVLMLIDKSLKDIICESIQKETDITHPKKGVLFTQSVNEVYGLYEGNK